MPRLHQGTGGPGTTTGRLRPQRNDNRQARDYDRLVTTIVDAIRDGRLDAELAALLWLLASRRVAIHVVPGGGADLAAAVRELAAAPDLVTDGPGASIEEVLRQPVPLRPPTGAIVVTGSDGRVAAAHLIRPPVRDGAGHVRPRARRCWPRDRGVDGSSTSPGA